ncbi:protein PHOX1 [Sesamum angolense]|uniref:Protein PHOX1 n=1 Tax=Sesamum angolense TaxID=2727404 RepID=A0AAE1T8R2_9LAMI|nr:protein PHOX1 [Sesamum angolense]
MFDDVIEEKNTEDKLVVEEEKVSNVIFARFPNSKAVLVKYKDREGDLVTITTTEELRWAEASTELGSVKLYVFEVSPDQDPLFLKVRKNKHDTRHATENDNVDRGKEIQCEPTCINDWIIHFAKVFKNYVGFDIDAYIDLHEVGMKLYLEAMEETVTSEEAQDLFGVAADKFQELAALALFDWGNVHISRARKRVYFTDDSSRESVLEQIKCSYDWAQKEFTKAGQRYEEALKMKSNFYEAVVALGQQQFERAKLSWYYAIGTGVDLESWPSGEVLMLYNSAEENMERGIQMWEDLEEHRLSQLSQPNRIEILLQKMKLDNLFKDISVDEAEEQATNIRSQIYVLWVAVEKFELAGASETDIAVMIKNHCSNNTGLEGLGFNIDEIVQAWNEIILCHDQLLVTVTKMFIRPVWQPARYVTTVGTQSAVRPF